MDRVDVVNAQEVAFPIDSPQPLPNPDPQIIKMEALFPSENSTTKEKVDYIRSRFKIIATPIDRSGMGIDLYLYDNGVYKNGNSFLRNVAVNLFGNKFSSHGLNEVMVLLKELSKVPYTLLNKRSTELINVQNGLIDWKSGTLVSHDPMLYPTFQIQATYDPSITSPDVDKYLTTVFPPDAEQLAEEILGLLLILDNSFQIFFVFWGSGENSKSTLLRILMALLGKQNVSTVSLQDLSENRFRTAELFMKVANICPDLPARTIEDSSIIKSLTGQDTLTVERKFGQPFDFTNFARLIFSCNEMPKSRDKTDAFYRRLVIIPFQKKFPPHLRDPQIFEKLTTPLAMSAWLNRALNGLRRLKTQGFFTIPESVNTANDEYRMSCDSALAFIAERTEFLEGAMTGKQELFNSYKQWCELNGIRPDSQRDFNKAIKNQGFRESIDKSVPGKAPRIWTNMGLKDE